MTDAVVSLGLPLQLSPSGRHVAVTRDTLGSERYELAVHTLPYRGGVALQLGREDDAARRVESPSSEPMTSLPSCAAGLSWSPDGACLFALRLVGL
jgi:hypothetical protein